MAAIKKQKPWGWTYGVIQNREGFSLHEVYSEIKKGEGYAWTEDPVSIHGETPEDVIKHLKWAIKDIQQGSVWKICKGKLSSLEEK